MRTTPIRLVRLVARSSVPPTARIAPEPTPTVRVEQRKTLIDHLTERRAAAGTDWPANIRLEPPVKRTAFKKMEDDVRKDLKSYLREN